MTVCEYTSYALLLQNIDQIFDHRDDAKYFSEFEISAHNMYIYNSVCPVKAANMKVFSICGCPIIGIRAVPGNHSFPVITRFTLRAQ